MASLRQNDGGKFFISQISPKGNWEGFFHKVVHINEWKFLKYDEAEGIINLNITRVCDMEEQDERTSVKCIDGI